MWSLVSFLSGFVAILISTGIFWALVYWKSVGNKVKTSRGFGTAKYALIIGCDGLGSYYLNANWSSISLPYISKFYTQGTHSASNVTRAQDPFFSAPNWTSLLCGMSPVEHGVHTNTWTVKDTNPVDPGQFQIPPISGRGKIPETLWRVAKQQRPSIKIVIATAWDWIHNLAEPIEITNMAFKGNHDDSSCVTALCSFIKTMNKPEMMFIHLDSIDVIGHKYSWGSPEYYSAIEVVDGYVGSIMNTLSDEGMLNDTLIIMTSDHGGYKNDHRMFNQYCMGVPALFLGPKIAKGKELTSRYISIKDFAPTVLNALGLQPGKYMTGRILEEIYED